MSSASRRLGHAAVDLAWSLWRELGVPGVLRRHADAAVVPEPLIIYTAALGGRDPRLRDEALGWCMDNGWLISTSALRSVFTTERWGVGVLADFAATIAQESRVVWPGAHLGRPLSTPRRRGALSGPFLTPAQLPLRLRALFGVGARAEILRVLLVDEASARTAAELAALAHTTKRNVSDAVAQLEASGVLLVDRGATPHRVRLGGPDAVATLVGPVPPTSPRWSPLLRIVAVALETSERVQDRPRELRAAEFRRMTRLLAPSLRAAELLPLVPSEEENAADPGAWYEQLAERLAAGSASTVTERSRT